MNVLADYSNTIIVVVAAMGTIIGAIAVIYRKVLRPAILMLDAVHDLVEFQLRPNGGGSLVDAVNRIEGKQGELHRRLEKIETYSVHPKEIP